MIKPENNPAYGTNGGNNTKDKVFLLSQKEVRRLLSNDKERIAKATDYVQKTKNYAKNRNTWWWLRSPGINSCHAAVVNSNGWIISGGLNVCGYDDGVRPALWLNL